MGRNKKLESDKAPTPTAFRLPLELKTKLGEFKLRSMNDGDLDTSETDVAISAISLLTYEQFRKFRKKVKSFSEKKEQTA